MSQIYLIEIPLGSAFVLPHYDLSDDAYLQPKIEFFDTKTMAKIKFHSNEKSQTV